MRVSLLLALCCASAAPVASVFAQEIQALSPSRDSVDLAPQSTQTMPPAPVVAVEDPTMMADESSTAMSAPEAVAVPVAVVPQTEAVVPQTEAAAPVVPVAPQSAVHPLDAVEPPCFTQPAFDLLLQQNPFTANFVTVPVSNSTAEPDSTGDKRIGYGSTCAALGECASLTPPISEALGRQLVRYQVFEEIDCLLGNDDSPLRVAMTDAQFSAVAIVSYAVDCNAVKKSTMWKLINQQQYSKAAEAMSELENSNLSADSIKQLQTMYASTEAEPGQCAVYPTLSSHFSPEVLRNQTALTVDSDSSAVNATASASYMDDMDASSSTGEDMTLEPAVVLAPVAANGTDVAVDPLTVPAAVEVDVIAVEVDLGSSATEMIDASTGVEMMDSEMASSGVDVPVEPLVAEPIVAPLGAPVVAPQPVTPLSAKAAQINSVDDDLVYDRRAQNKALRHMVNDARVKQFDDFAFADSIADDQPPAEVPVAAAVLPTVPVAAVKQHGHAQMAGDDTHAEVVPEHQAGSLVDVDPSVAPPAKPATSHVELDSKTDLNPMESTDATLVVPVVAPVDPTAVQNATSAEDYVAPSDDDVAFAVLALSDNNSTAPASTETQEVAPVVSSQAGSSVDGEVMDDPLLVNATAANSTKSMVEQAKNAAQQNALSVFAAVAVAIVAFAL